MWEEPSVHTPPFQGLLQPIFREHACPTLPSASQQHPLHILQTPWSGPPESSPEQASRSQAKLSRSTLLAWTEKSGKKKETERDNKLQYQQSFTHH